MPRIRLLTSVAGDGPVHGAAGDELDVDAATARTWADGERAERVTDSPAAPAEAAATTTRPRRPARGRQTPPEVR